jgi:2-dehydro-3-deoxyglucarate aldolase
MNKIKGIRAIRTKMDKGKCSIGSWMQIPHGSVAEIMGNAGYDWVAVDMEHGSITVAQLPDLFRALELGGTLPLVRLARGDAKECKQVLDAGAGGVIVPMVETGEQLIEVRNASCWPPAGTRGVGFSRANLFGKNFETYREEAQAPLLVAMIEHTRAVDNLEEILSVEGLDAILIGPYDLSASMGLTGRFEHPAFKKTMQRIRSICRKNKVPSGIHVITPEIRDINNRIQEGYQFVVYSTDAMFLWSTSSSPKIKRNL